MWGPKKRHRSAEALQTELAELQIPDVDEPLLLRTPLPGLFSDSRQFALIIQTCEALIKCGRGGEAEQVVEQALDVGRGRGMSTEQRRQLREVIADEASGVLQFDVAQQLIQEQPYSLKGWDIFHKLTLQGMERTDRRAKFLQSMRARYPDSVPALLVSGHQNASSGLLQSAAREYLSAYRLQPHDPLIALCCGVSLLNLASGSRLRNRLQCVLQAFTFFHRYAHLRNHSQEAEYNLGRAYHQAGLLHLAVEHYERVLCSTSTPQPSLPLPGREAAAPPGPAGAAGAAGAGSGGAGASPLGVAGPGVGSLISGQWGRTSGFAGVSLGRPASGSSGGRDLSREAAHNLIQIYNSSGAHQLARSLMHDYLTI